MGIVLLCLVAGGAYYWYTHRDTLNTALPLPQQGTKQVLNMPYNPIFKEVSASIPDATIVNITSTSVDLRDDQKNLATFPLSSTAQLIDFRAANASGSSALTSVPASNNLGQLKPGTKLTVIVKLLGGTYQADQFVILRPTK